ncbi:apolipoprotein N-acyltransferase [Roseococcus sp. SDR]|uniref:apolipoprotein N-acyltransferase n=1 Tax=Roseococcus sp. SDR TaxID=2835532 RepID=UPI001BD0AAF9|nr:apolipoprotein N-acyltransferase [Roseococcus sp. SDR]MBS7791732.1 apolipoprotein N-acyltransferase [Roseococcus sp. SDR]MBV1847046.1 apolipoprotein N-acyltransferase [Roseococcus sp. SDR]
MPAFLLNRPWLLAFLLGALSVLAMPPVHAVPVLLATIPGFLWLLGRAPGWRRAAWWGFGFGFGFHVAGLYWITHSLFTDVGRWWWLVPVAAPGIALPMAAFSVIPALAAWWLPPGWRRWLGFGAAWVAAEMLRGILFTGFPWNLLGTVWAFHALPLQPASVIGVHGLSLLTVLLAGLPVLRSRAAWAGGIAVLALWMGFGAWRLAEPLPPDHAVRLVLVQGNVAQDTKWDPARRMPIFQRYLELSAEGARAQAAAHPGQPILVIWPETASPFLLAQDAEAMRLAGAALPPEALLLAGTVRAEWGSDGRLQALFNSLVALDPTGRAVGLFDKAHLVPFGEYMPLGGILPIRMVTGGVDFSAGPGPEVLHLPGGLPSPGPLICYEVIFPARVVGEERPAWLLNVTNDAWFGISAGPYQHLAAARLRAVEEGLPMVRAAQTGVSAIFDATGRERARLGLGASGLLMAELPAALAPTLFARCGLWLPLGFLVLFLVFSVPWRRSPSGESG